jgi:hypothetical protein
VKGSHRPQRVWHQTIHPGAPPPAMVHHPQHTSRGALTASSKHLFTNILVLTKILSKFALCWAHGERPPPNSPPERLQISVCVFQPNVRGNSPNQVPKMSARYSSMQVDLWFLDVLSAWFLERFFGVLGQCVIRKSARHALETCFYARDTENGRWSW